MERQAGRLSSGLVHQLPKDAQWEYAYRERTSTAAASGDVLSSTQANFNGDWPHNWGQKSPSLLKAVEVNSYPCNAWGIYNIDQPYGVYDHTW